MYVAQKEHSPARGGGAGRAAKGVQVRERGESEREKKENREVEGRKKEGKEKKRRRK